MSPSWCTAWTRIPGGPAPRLPAPGTPSRRSHRCRGAKFVNHLLGQGRPAADDPLVSGGGLERILFESGYALLHFEWRMSLSENRCPPSPSQGHAFPGHALAPAAGIARLFLLAGAPFAAEAGG